MSTKSAGLAAKLGYTNIKVMLKGVPGWKKTGRAVVASDNFVKTGNIVLIDTRSEAEYTSAHIPRAHNLTVADFEDELPSSKGAPIVIYGDGAEAAYKAAKKLGYKKSALYPAGMTGWTAAGNPVTSGATPEEITWKRKLGKGEVGAADFMKAADGDGSTTIILDVRTSDEAGDGMFNNAVSIPLDELEAKSSTLPKDKTILVHCTTGARAEMASQELKKQGFKVKFLIGNVECEDGECEIDED